MITPASVEDWVLFAGLLGMLNGFAALGYRSMIEERKTETPIHSGPVPASTIRSVHHLVVAQPSS